MKLEQAIHTHWGERVALAALLAVDRFTTGRTSSRTIPYATLDVRTAESLLPTNQGAALELVALRIHVWHEVYDDGRMIAEQIVEAFDGVSLELTEPTCFARVSHTTSSIRQHADGLWHWSIRFKANICLLP